VELLASDTEGCQRIVASSFNRIGMQFVRYDTGNLAVAPSGDCTVNHFPRVGAIVGRSQETFVDAAGRRRALGPDLFGIHGPFWDHIKDLQVVQERPGHLLVRFVASAGADKDLIQKVLQRRMPMVELGFEYVSVVERSPSGKRRYFTDSLQPAASEALPSMVIGDAHSAAARGRRDWRWIAAAVAVFAVAVVTMSLLLMRVSGAHPATVRAHGARHPIVNVKAPVRYVQTESPGFHGRQPAHQFGRPGSHSTSG
jgi:hypothetical protein